MHQRENLVKQCSEILNEDTVCIYLERMQHILSKRLEAPKTRIPGSYIFIFNIIGSMYWIDASLVYLIWLLKYPTQKQIENDFGVPQSTAGEVLTWFKANV